MPCPNEHVLIPMERAGQWASRTDPITDEAIWVRADVACKVAEQLIARAVAGDLVLQPEGFRPPVEVAFAHWLLRIDARWWPPNRTLIRRLRRRAAA